MKHLAPVPVAIFAIGDRNRGVPLVLSAEESVPQVGQGTLGGRFRSHGGSAP